MTLRVNATPLVAPVLLLPLIVNAGVIVYHLFLLLMIIMISAGAPVCGAHNFDAPAFLAFVIDAPYTLRRSIALIFKLRHISYSNDTSITMIFHAIRALNAYFHAGCFWKFFQFWHIIIIIVSLRALYRPDKQTMTWAWLLVALLPGQSDDESGIHTARSSTIRLVLHTQQLAKSLIDDILASDYRNKPAEIYL